NEKHLHKNKKMLHIYVSSSYLSEFVSDGFGTVLIKPAAEVSKGHFPPPLWIRTSTIYFSIFYRLLLTLSTIFDKRMRQAFLNHSIIPHFEALYSCTLSKLPLDSLPILDTVRYR